MIVVTDWSTPQQIERDIPVVRRLREYWESLNDGMPPERDMIDPEAIKDLLPNMLLVDFESNPFRVRYRLTGTRVDIETGCNLTGRYLDEFLLEPFKAASTGISQLHHAYEQVWRSARPQIGAYEWSPPPMQTRMPFGIFPVTVHGQLVQAIAIEQLHPSMPSFQTKTWWDLLAIHDAGGPSEIDLIQYRYL